MFDIPASVVDNLQNIDWGQVVEQVQEYRPALETLQKTWTKETLREMLDGNVAVSDDAINQALAEQLESAGTDGANIKSIKIASHENGIMDINADTEKMGRIEFTGTIENFVHNSETSEITYKVKTRALKDHGLASWFFSRISLSMAQDIFGKIELSEALPTKIKGNTITVDFKQLLENSELAQREFKGHRLIDMIEIEEAVPKDGYIAFKTKLNLPDDVKAGLVAYVNDNREQLVSIVDSLLKDNNQKNK